MSRPKKPRLNRPSALRYDDTPEDFRSSVDDPETGNADMDEGGLESVSDSSAGISPQSLKSQSLPESNSSGDAADLSADSRSAEPRALRLARIKAQIEAGEYETEEKLDAALSRLFEELGAGDEDHES